MKVPPSSLGLNAILAFLIETQYDGELRIDSEEYDRWALEQHNGGNREPSIVVGEVLGEGDDRETVLTTMPTGEVDKLAADFFAGL